MINPDLALFNLEAVVACAPESLEQAAFLAHWCVPASLPYFAGHFPDNPVLPAVAVMDATLELIKAAAGAPHLELARVKSAKFSQPIRPGHELEIRLAERAPTDARQSRWTAVWKCGKTSVAELAFDCRLHRELRG